MSHIREHIVPNGHYICFVLCTIVRIWTIWKRIEGLGLMVVWIRLV